MPPRAAPRLLVVVEPLGRFDAAEEALWWEALGARPHAFYRRAAGPPSDLPRWSFLASDPVEILRSDSGSASPAPDPFAALAARWPARVTREGPSIPFVGGFAGVLGYEVRSAVERSPRPRPAPDGFPSTWLGRYDAVLAFDHVAHLVYVTGVGQTRGKALAARDRLLARATQAPTTGSRPRIRSTSRAPRPVVSSAAYRGRVEEVRRRIARGDLFQANVSQRFEGRFGGSAVELFDRLTTASPTPLATFVSLGDGRSILSASPERFLALRAGRLETRPMKGTRRRGATPSEDRALARDLARSTKDGAELAMIVDLARNDLARSCRPGTVRVDEARRLERYASVHQAIGVVSGTLSENVHPVEAIRRAFPPGSVTGAPKVEAMRVIDALEGEARGAYCGAIGWFDEGGDFDLAVAIRTVTLHGSRVSYRVGGGITWLSDPESERVETLVKGAALSAAITGSAPTPTSRRRTRAGGPIRRRDTRP